MSKPHFSDRIKEYEAPLDPGAWEAMDALLDGKVAKPGANGSGRKYLWLILLLVILSGAGLYGSRVFDQNREVIAHEKPGENNNAISGKEGPLSSPEGASVAEAKTDGNQTNKSSEEPLGAAINAGVGVSNGENKPAEETPNANEVQSANGSAHQYDEQRDDPTQKGEVLSNSTTESVLERKPAEIREQLMVGLSAKTGEQIAVEPRTEGNEKGQSVENSAEKRITKGLADETITSESESVKRISGGSEKDQSRENDAVKATTEEAVNEADASQSEFLEEEARAAMVGKKEVQGIDPKVIPGTGGNIPSGFTTVRMDGFESRPKGMPEPEASTTVTTFPIENVSFFIGYAESGTTFGFRSNRGLTGGRFNLGVSYLLSDRLRLETEYGNTTLTFVGQVSNGQKNEKVSFRGQHVRLKYRLTENDLGELRVYGGGGIGKYVYDSFVNPQTGPFATPIEVVNDTSNLLSLDFGVAGLCTWSNIWVETYFGIMHNEAFNDGSIIFNYGASVYFNPWKNRK